MRARISTIGILTLMAMLVGIEARAQAIFLTAPQELFNLKFDRATPNLDAPAPIAPPPAQSHQSGVAQAGLAESRRDEALEQTFGAGSVLRHLTNNIQGYRLAGEIGASEWPIYVTQAQAKRAQKFQLGYLAAVSVMPEASTLTLTINDRVIGEIPIRAVRAVETTSFAIPAGALRPGFNSVRIATNQRHRVDCSLEATYELWTQIDPTQTGLLLEQSDASVDNLADLAALLPDEHGALPIRVVLPAAPNPAHIERALRAAQLVSIIGRFGQPVIDIGPLAAGRHGVNLLVGTAAELARDVDLAPFGAINSPRAMVLPAAFGRRPTIIVTAATAAQVDTAMTQFLVATTPRGSLQGLRAAASFPGFRMDGGQRVKLRDLGIASEEFTGRFFRASFNIIMPPDFYAADYGRAQIRLAGGYAPGLSPKSEIVLRVNDRAAVSLALPAQSGDIFQGNPLPLPLGFLRPGLNRIEIEAHVPTNEDAHCDPLSSIDAAKRFLFLDSTEFELPAIAQIARAPDLAVTSTGGFPFVGAGKRPKLFIPALDQKSIGAAATIGAHFAIAAGRLIDFEVIQTPPRAGEGPVLAVAALDAFDPALLRKLDFPIDRLRTAWGVVETEKNAGALPFTEAASRNRAVLQRNFPMACYDPKPEPQRSANKAIDNTSVGSIGRARSSDAQELFDKWDASLHSEARPGFDILGALRLARDWSVEKFSDTAGRMRFASDGEAGERQPISERTRLALGQGALGDSSGDVWTIVTAPNSSTLAEAAACLVDPRISRQISGRFAALDMREAKVGVEAAENSRFIVTQPLSIRNIRLIAAGWMSLHLLAYVSSTLFLAGLLAISTQWFVRHVGRKTQ